MTGRKKHSFISRRNRAEYDELNDVSIRTANYDLEVMEKLRFMGVGRAIKYQILHG